MDVEHMTWLHEYIITDAVGKDAIALEFSYDSGFEHAPRFFRVPQKDVPEAHALYAALGGSRGEGFRSGTTVKGPSLPFAPSIKLWREIGNP